MADALVNPEVAITTGFIAASLLGVASKKIAVNENDNIIPKMGVLGAFIFSAQMINFSIPGTGSSGHIIGGVLLASLLGPWAAFITLSSVLIIQCLIFADGGLMALGCNLINMGAMSCLVAYPFIYKPIVGKSLRKTRIMLGSILACMVGLELGALLVTLETELSGITALPFGHFLLFMLPIHFAIGVCEGIATGLVICFVAGYNSDLLVSREKRSSEQISSKRMTRKTKTVLISFISLAFFLAIGFSWIASSNPDGLEWSIKSITGVTDLAPATPPPSAILPEYNSAFSGLIGGVIVITVLWCITSLIFRRKRKFIENKDN